MMKKGILILSILAIAAAVPALAQRSQVVQVPVAGEYLEAAIGGDLAYEGTLYHVWTPTAGGSEWNVTSILVAEARVKATGARLSLFGVAAQSVTADPGTEVTLVRPIEVSGIGSSGGFPRALALGSELPRLAAVPSERSIAIEPAAPATLQVAVPVRGEYYEAAVGGEMSYEGVITLIWTPPSAGIANWTMSGTLVAQATSTRTGDSFVYLGFCADCFSMAPGATVVMTKPVLAFGVGRSAGAAGFQGAITVAMELPRGAPVPLVSSVTLASR